MEQDLFQDILSKYMQEMKCIQGDLLQKAYSKFTFKYLSSNLIKNHDSEVFETRLINFLREYQFITYQISDSSQKLSLNKLFEKNDTVQSCLESNSPNVNVVICVEGFCLIIESIDKDVLFKIFNNIKSEFLNVSKNINDQNIIDEITNFCKHNSINAQFKSNYFLFYN